jgi:type III pantothenate kinase
MLLAIDVGNTQTVIGLFTGDRLSTHWRVSTNLGDTEDELHIKIRGLLSLSGISERDIEAVALSSVVPPLTGSWDNVAQTICGERAVKADLAHVPWLDISYDSPVEIGSDRIADAVGAIERYGAPVVVVDLGTATNIEVIDRDRCFLGGVIAPGFVTSSDALFEAASRIPRFDLRAPSCVIGSSTREAVQSGLVFGEVDRIDGLVRRIWNELGYHTSVIATGGLAHRISNLSTTITATNETLTLEGLQIIYQRSLV